MIETFYHFEYDYWPCKARTRILESISSQITLFETTNQAQLMPPLAEILRVWNFELLSNYFRSMGAEKYPLEFKISYPVTD